MSRRRMLRGWLVAAAGLLLAAVAHAHDTVYYYSSDSVHSEVVITDANRNVVERTYYAPYGQVLNRSLRDGPGYTGHEEDPETSLVYMQQRYYDPEAGRFLSADPVEAADNGANFNRYWYAKDNPYRYTDPDGRCADGFSCDQIVQSFGAHPVSTQTAEFAASALPVAGDVVNVADAVKNPSALTITAAVIGVIPEGGALVGKALKTAAKIFGKAQVTLKAGKETMHAATSARIAAEEATRADAKSVHLNQTIGTATGDEVKSSLRPDVQTVRTDGKVDVQEVLSPGQDANASAAKYNNALGNKAGTIKCVPQDKC